jgi:hypothetical protein
MDVARVEALRARGYRVETRTLPREVTPVNRVILGAPLARAMAVPGALAAAADVVGGTQQMEEHGWVPIAASLPDSPWRRYT